MFFSSSMIINLLTGGAIQRESESKDAKDIDIFPMISCVTQPFTFFYSVQSFNIMYGKIQ